MTREIPPPRSPHDRPFRSIPLDDDEWCYALDQVAGPMVVEKAREAVSRDLHRRGLRPVPVFVTRVYILRELNEMGAILDV